MRADASVDACGYNVRAGPLALPRSRAASRWSRTIPDNALIELYITTTCTLPHSQR